MTKADRRSVFITGASSGIGRACATRLARAGFRVFASVRRSKDHAPLGFADEGIEPVEMDVTDATSIAAAAARVGAALSARGLDGLVNNAGTGVSGPLEYVDLDVLRHEFEVDVFGQIAVTQAFLPLIRRARGRIVNMGSVGARLSMPFGGVLCGAKSAFAAMTDALRLELHPFGIHVCLVEPAAIRTPALDKTLGDVEGVISKLPPEGALRYGPMLRAFTARSYKREEEGSEPDVVARAVEEALTRRWPKARYSVGKNARVLSTLPRLFSQRILDRIRRHLFDLPKAFGGLPEDAR
jgi:NAD(P)-dependent dehydrogenase (short-subunit alcohol dehydrogenase family)